MKTFRNLFFIFLLGNCTTNTFAQYIQVNDSFSAQYLVENVLINSPCANVSNFKVSGGNFGTLENSFGYFNSGSSGFPFLDGIVLSTSKAISTQGPNSSILSDDASGWGGDSDLEQALNISNTSNASVLEFDFTPLTSKISFDYIFASEEYHGTASCKYSDGFAFLLKVAGSANPYQNLAVVPNTTTPVKVTTVHPDISGGCSAQNETYFGSFNGVNSPTNFNGQTVAMTAKADVIPGTTYHIKLVIADEANPQYDSAIFLGGGSFKIGTDLGPNRLIATKNPICDGKTLPLDASETGTNFYKWYRNNSLIVGANNPKYTVSSSGTYKVEVTLGTSACKSIGEVTVEYSPLPNLTNTTIVQCDEDHNGTTMFNLTKTDNIIKNNDPNLGNVVYYENLLDAQNQTKPISNPNAYSSIPKTIYASVPNAFGCSSIANVILQISNNSVSSRDLESCDLDGIIDGYYGFDLSKANPIVLAGLPSGLVVEYYETMSDALLQTKLLANIYRNTVQYQMTIYAKIVNGSDCYGIVPLRLYANSNSPLNFEDEVSVLCDGNSQTLQVASTFSSYSWSTGDKGNSTKVKTPGEFTVTVSDKNTCLATKKFTVLISGSPTITSIISNDFQENGNTVLINYTGFGDYEFSLDGIFYQDSPYFTNVSSGVYTVWARDKNGCGKTSKKVYVLDYPKYFTPNDDGFNDIWTIENINTIPNSKITIYDRYGKLVYQFKGNGNGWNGKLNSINLPATDYWFVISLENDRIVKGHFTLKR
ncbi:T9SS type B sorting domain-containing protein [Flavobacterium psychrotolerans]|uniref:T9SS type B sorting domain-containing protein n=1 Tax=Flavobacterium psychrotolerans TaxID=2169410 RepID=A0A2U1JJK1_9FLAO|nr:T9SS type B sorting domain-containing protein [Flavobacterium psychrotolerans]PWA05043.1 hypothetical protein DB895_08400 [Flavobacterium psychrotolerans]